MTLLLIGVVAGLIAGISPCVVPVLPVIFAAGATNEDRSNWRRSLSIVVGLMVSFCVLVLAGDEIISVFHLPQTFLHYLGIFLLLAVGVGLLFPLVGRLLERPFERLTIRRSFADRGGFVIGLALGLVFTPCAGPVLATITEVGSREHVNLTAVFLAIAFSVGAAIPLLFVALAGGAIVRRARVLREHAPLLRRIGGAVFVLIAVGIKFNVFDSLQTDVPGYTNALQQHVESSNTVRQQLNSVKGLSTSSTSLTKCPAQATTLVNCGAAPNFTDATAWLNTPDDKPLSVASLKGKVVLVDFWTYSCINCQRSLPHVEAWYQRYKADGLVVVGVHTPEFAFEHVVSNVKAEAASFGVKYPIDVDDNYGTWNAYDNEYWPAEYLVDAKGVVRHVDFGEGNYGLTETLIRQLLLAAHPGLTLPRRTDVPNLTPQEPTNPETYVGYENLQYVANAEVPTPNEPSTSTFPSTIDPGYLAFSGTWTEHEQEATADRHAELELGYQAEKVYLVMGGTGTVSVSLGHGAAPQVIHVSGVPRLYTLMNSPTLAEGVMTMKFSPGVQAYDFTFG